MSAKDNPIPCSFSQEKHTARVYLAEAKRRRYQPFGFVLLEWAGNCRRRAMKAAVQGELAI